MGTRARLLTVKDVVIKQYYDPKLAAAEAYWYERVPWACPKLLDFDPEKGKLTIQYRPSALDNPGWRPVQELLDMLADLHTLGINHRDVWPGNLVIGEGGEPLLIDWETAIEVPPHFPSYDLHGPLKSRIAPPAIHRAIRSARSPNGYEMWVGANHPCSIKSMWRADVIPAAMG
jgi:serine/threonine protein kinase